MRTSVAERAIFQFVTGDGGYHPLSARPISTGWYDRRDSVVRTSGEQPSNGSFIADSFGRPQQSTLQVQFVGGEASQPQPPKPELLPAQEFDSSPPVTLHCDDLEVRKVLEMLSREGPVNVLVAPGVTGRVTANLEGMSFHQALGAILKLCNLVAHREGDLIFVYTPGELAQLEGRDRRLVTRVYHLNYVRASDVQQMITPFLSNVGNMAVTPASAVGIESDPDSVGGDSLAGGEVLIVQDHENVINTIDDIVARLDVQPAQVLIEAVIMEAILEDGMELGVNFAVLDNAGEVLTVLGSGAALNAAAGFTPAQLLTAGAGLIEDKYPEGTEPPPNNQKIQSGGALRKGFAANDNGLKFGFVDDDVTGFVRALQQAGEINVLASPRVLVLNKQRAEIIIGEKLGFLTIVATETSSMENFQQEEVGTQLRVRPFVTADGMIRMEIHPERSSGTLVGGIPQTRTSEVTTNVIVPDGSTIVIAGLIEEQDVLAENGIPGLSRLPWVGALFRYRSTTTVKKELIVLLTPRIWTPEEASPPVEPWSRTLPDRVPKVPVRHQRLSMADRGQPSHACATPTGPGAGPGGSIPGPPSTDSQPPACGV